MYMRTMLLVGILLALASCAQRPVTPGDAMLNQSEDAHQLAEDWNHGQALIAKAEKLNKKGEKSIQQGKKNVKKGNKLLEKGDEQIASGHSMLEDAAQYLREGQKIERETEERYNQKFPGKLKEFFLSTKS